MNFFEKIKTKLEEGFVDLSTIEHAMIRENDGKQELLLYRTQGIDGDAIVYQTADPLDPALIRAFNEAFQASMTSRLGIVQAMITIFND